MSFSLTWLPDVLLAANLKVAKVDGWEARGRGPMGAVFGVICHHTGGTRPGNMPALDLLTRGRADLAGPLAQLGLGRDGTYYVVSSGRANHAGRGMWMGATGNRHFIGIEAMHSGLRDEPWPEVQLDAYRRGVAAILAHLGLAAERCAGHKEYAQPRGRKPDPNLDMHGFRASVAAIMRGETPPLAPIPVAEPHHGAPTLRRGVRHPAVEQLRALLDLPRDEAFDGGTEARVRQFQRDHELVPDGIVGPKTWAELRVMRAVSGPEAARGAAPSAPTSGALATAADRAQQARDEAARPAQSPHS